MLDRALTLIRDLARQFLSAAVWRAAWQLPWWMVMLIAAVAFVLLVA